MEFRKPFPLEEKHFVELVAYHQSIQNKTGLSQARKLRAEVVRFGYKAAGKNGLMVYCGDPDVEINDLAVVECRVLMATLTGRQRSEPS